MKILVRLPNWLGDMVMSVAFVRQLAKTYPGAEIHVIVKKGLEELLPFFPHISGTFVFNKQDYPGLQGAWKFGKEISRKQPFDLCFVLPNSFSSAAMAYATRAAERIGYRNEMRSLLLTRAYSRPGNVHRVTTYLRLLTNYSGKAFTNPNVKLEHGFLKENYVVLNINSEASSRRLTLKKAVELLNTIISKTSLPVYMIGSPKEKLFVDEVASSSLAPEKVVNMAGKTALPELCRVLASARLMISTDSGPAHLANALGTETIVLFGAGNELHTAPFNKDLCTVIRLGELSCEPCEKNTCVRFDTPQCLERLSSHKIAETALSKLNGQKLF